MRYDTRYIRVLNLITDPVIPRTSHEGIALCHLCQRQMVFKGGYLKMLTEILEYASRAAHVRKCRCDTAYREAYYASRKEK